MSSGQSCDGHSRAGTGHVIKTHMVTEPNRSGMATVLTAYPDLQTRPGFATAFHRDLHQCAYPFDVQGFKGILRQDSGLSIEGQKLVLRVFPLNEKVA